jgi:hypothetical protein
MRAGRPWNWMRDFAMSSQLCRWKPVKILIRQLSEDIKIDVVFRERRC